MWRDEQGDCVKKIICVLICGLTSSAASAAVIANIKLSREVPEMVAEAAWDAPIIDEGSARTPSATPKAVLWESSITVSQKAQKATTAFDISGAMPAHVPAGALFTGWRLADGSQVLCTQAAEAVDAPGKAALAVCLTPDGGATVRKNGKRYADAARGTLSGKASLTPGFTEADNARLRPWPGPVLYFSYQQVAEKGALLREPSNHGAIMAVGQLSLGNRIVLGAVKGDLVTLEHRVFDLGDYTNALSARKDSGYKRAEATVDIAAGAQTVSLGGGSFRIWRTPEKLIAVEALTPVAPDWSIDPATGRLLIEGRPYVLGAQEV